MFVWFFFFNFLLQYAICIPSQRWLRYAAMRQSSAVNCREFVQGFAIIQSKRCCIDASRYYLHRECNVVVILPVRRISH